MAVGLVEVGLVEVGLEVLGQMMVLGLEGTALLSPSWLLVLSPLVTL